MKITCEGCRARSNRAIPTKTGYRHESYCSLGFSIRPSEKKYITEPTEPCLHPNNLYEMLICNIGGHGKRNTTSGHEKVDNIWTNEDELAETEGLYER